MEQRNQPINARDFQAPKGEAPVVPQLQSKSGEFTTAPQQAASPDIPTAQPSGLEHQTKPQEGKPVARDRGGSKERKQLETTPSGELYVGSLIRKLRREKNLELRAVAHELGFTPAKLSAIETNHNLPSEEDLNKFAELLETSVDDFHQAYQHPRTIRRTPPEQSKRMPIHLQGKPLDEVDIAMHYRANIRWSARFRQPTW